MAKLKVVIDIPDTSIEDCWRRGILDSMDYDFAIIDEAYLKRWGEDEDFFVFLLEEAHDDD